MLNRKGIYWLSSYPKSGNTWFRIFLANVLNLSGLLRSENESPSAGPININHVDYHINDRITTSRTWVNQICGFNTAWLTDDELDALMPELYTWYSEQQTQVSYHKIHRAYTYVNPQRPLIPLNQCLGVIYFVRNPLDIAVSLANHFTCSIDEAIKMMGDTKYALYHYPLRQLLSSWSMHVKSWMESAGDQLLLLRYEDLLMNPLETFTQAIQFLQLDVTSSVIKQAISYSSFDKLQQFENTIGFIDKPPRLKHFFKKGIAGNWQVALTAIEIQNIIQDHADVMKKLGYLNKYYEPLIG